MNPTLDQMIRRAISGSPEPESDPTVVSTVPPRAEPSTVSETEKIATALEFIGRRGVVNMVKEAGAAPPPGTNIGTQLPTHMQSTHTSTKMAPPMAPKSTGAPDDNMNDRPGPNADQAQLGGDGQTHHAAISSADGQTTFTKKEKAKQVSGDLSALFSAPAFADGKLKENFSSASEGGDKNIHKAASAASVKTDEDRELLKQALSKKLVKKTSKSKGC